LVVDLTGADPTLVAGGELGLESEFDVIEALSEIVSLTGVLGRSLRVSGTMLGCLLGGRKFVGIIEVAD
jgi:hypothetical protein